MDASPGNPDRIADSEGTEFLSASGELASYMRDMDWASTPLGPPAEWPQSLKTVTRILLDSRYAMWMGWGPDLTFFYNDAYARDTLGKKHPWALGRPAREVWAEIWNDIKPRVDHVFQSAQATWDEGLQLFLERNGYPEETYHTFSYSPLYDDNGALGGMLCVVTEETNRVIAERRAALLRDLASSLTTIKTEADVLQAVQHSLDANARDLPFTLTFLFSDNDPQGRLVLFTGGPSEHPLADPSSALHWPLEQVMQTNSSVEIDNLAERFKSLPTGPWNKPPQQALLVPIAQQGQTRPAGVFVTGINPHRVLDESYRGFINLFTGQIAAALSNAHAYEAERKRAEALLELDRAKTTFFSNVSHEFRTPLTLMLGPLQDVISQTDGAMPKRAIDELTIVHRNGLRLLKLVNTLLDFSRIEAGRVQANYEPSDLSKFTIDLASVFRSAIERAGLKLIVDCPALREPVYVDRSMWEKVVLNLLSNAFKFTLEGEIRVNLRPVDGHVELSVQDTGSGIPAHELPRLFERFHRVEGSKGRTHEGTGIGLALVQELVRLHGGAVHAESQVDKGSTFRVRIPFGKAHLAQDRISAASNLSTTALGYSVFVEEAQRWLPGSSDENAPAYEEASAPKQSGDGPRPRVLLADDNADMRQYVRRLLSGEYEVTAVNDGTEALSSLRESRFDLLISDVMMPNLDGFGLLGKLRAHPELASLPVILLSARAGEEATLEGLQAGADDYLVKPFSARELLGRVAALLERKRFQRALAEADDRLRLALQAARMATWEWDPAADAAVMSDNAPAVYGLTTDDGIRNTTQAKTLIHPDDFEPHMARLREAIDNLNSFQSQFRIIRPIDGKIAWLSERGVARRDSTSGKIRMLGVVMDITDIKQAEGQREELLASERAARSEAERAGRLKEEFLTTLSHELRTPLNAILGWAQILENGPRDPETVEEGLAVISRNARAQTQLIEDLLDMSRITSGKLRLDVQRLDLADVINAAIESVRPAAEAKEIRLIKILGSVRTVVAGDPHRLQQVVWNLLSNAIKFTPKGGRVQVVLEQISSHVELTVSDNGQGIHPSFLPHVFERFRQADASTKRSYGGLGLGLSIVKQLVELHGGTVRARSDGERMGASFTVLLPVVVAHEGDGDGQSSSVRNGRAEAFSPISLRDLIVLVVDDEPDARDLVKRILGECGAQVFTASSVSEAMQAFRKHHPHVIVSDIGMPDQDGYELMRQVRRLPAGDGGQTPAAALTAYARPQDRRLALLAGYQSHVVKPADPAELITVVASLAGRLQPAASND